MVKHSSSSLNLKQKKHRNKAAFSQEKQFTYQGGKSEWTQISSQQYLVSPNIAQRVKNPPAMWETWVQSLGWEDPLEKGTGYPLQYSGLENSTDCITMGSQGLELSNLRFQLDTFFRERKEMFNDNLPLKKKKKKKLNICNGSEQVEKE